MPTIKLTPRTIERAVRGLGRELEREAIRGMQAAAFRTQRHIVTQVIPTARPRPPIGVTGLYRSSWKVQPTKRGAIVYNDSPYAGVVELGRRPGTYPPRRAIYRWIRRVLRLDEKEARRALFPIMRKIKTKRIKGRNILRTATVKARRFVEQETIRAFRRVEDNAGSLG